RAATAMNSFGTGRGAGAGAAAAAGAGGAGAGEGALGAGAGAGAGLGAAAGAAADAAVVAGRLAQPVIISPASSSDISVTCAARVTMTPPLTSARDVRSTATNAITGGGPTMSDLWPPPRPTLSASSTTFHRAA